MVGMTSGNSAQVLNAISTSERTGLFGRTLSASAAFITRSRGAVQTFK